MARALALRNGRTAIGALLLLAGCGRQGEPQPEDGGWPLERADISAEEENLLMHDPCARKEHERWHRSEGHCIAMMPPQRLKGIWIKAFEVTDFVPRATTLAEAASPESYRHELEIDEARVERLTGPIRGAPGGVGYALEFVGRRARDPYWVDCQGKPEFHVIVDDVLSARFLGPVPPPAHVETIAETIRRLRSQPVTVTVRHGGKWGRLEAEALEKCRRDHERAGDQIPSQPSPAGNSSAL
jgi:hypothetical protein